MKRRILAFALCFLLAFSCLNVGAYAAAPESTMAALTRIAKKFPHGKYWNHVGSNENNPDGVTDTPCDHHYTGVCSWTSVTCDCNIYNSAIQCMGYAYKIANEITCTNPRTWTKITTLKASELCVGDLISYSASANPVKVTIK